MSRWASQASPGAELRGSVDALWLHAQEGDGDVGTTSTAVYPDGCIDLVFHAHRAAGRVVEARLLAVGASRTAFRVTLRDGDSYVGARFRPGLSRLFLDADPRALVGREVRAAELEPRFAALEATLAEAASPDAALAILTAAIAADACRRARWAAPPRTRQALALIGAGEARMPVSEVARAVGASERSLRRDIVAWTGLAPARLSRIFRLQGALALMAAVPGRSLTSIAAEAGYADHPHMAREFRDLADLSPSEVLRRAA